VNFLCSGERTELYFIAKGLVWVSAKHPDRAFLR
jgi:hypothetical protein